MFFLACVIVAGVYGAFHRQQKIFYVQALPAMLAIVFTILAARSDV
jgi:putative membrane protein